MTPRVHKRASLFPTYSPPDDAGPSAEYLADYIDRVAKRVMTIGAALALIGGGAGFLGIHVLSPGDVTVRNEARLKALEDTVRSNSHRLTNAETLMANNLYISCKMLAVIQPASIPPKECSP